MWWDLVWVAVALILVLVTPLVFLYARRRWLTRQGGTFDCAMRRYENASGLGWSLGMGRYRGEELQWFRAFSFSLRPKVRLHRGFIRSMGTKEPTRAESLVLFDDSCIITVREITTGRDYNFGVDRDAAMALMSWIEAAPPGMYR